MTESKKIVKDSWISKIGNQLGINRTVMAISFARLGDAIGNSILIIVVPLYVAQLPAPWFPFPESVRVGLLISLFGLVNALLQPFMGALSDRLGKRKLLIFIGLVLMGLATLGFTLAGRYVDLVVLRLVQGIGVAITIPASMALMADATEKATRGSSMGVYSTMRMVGFATGPLIGGFLHQYYGFNIPFIVGALFILVGIITVLIWVKEVPTEGTPEPNIHFQLVDRSLINLGVIGAGLATLVMASDFSMISALENEFNARLNQGALGFGIAFSAVMVSRLLFQVPLGRLSDRWGRKPLIIAGLVFMAPVTVLLGLVGTTLQFTGMRLLQGVASAAIAAPAFALAADSSKIGGEGRQMSLVTMGFGLGIALGPLLSGALAVYSFILPFVVGGLLSIAAAVMVLQFVPETVKRGDQMNKKNATAHAEGD